MNRRVWRAGLSMLSILCWTVATSAIGQTKPGSPQAVATATQPAPKSTGRAASATSGTAASAAQSRTPSPPPIGPKVAEVLERGCAVLADAKTLTYHAEITFDEVLPSLVKIQYAGAMEVAVERPNRLAVKFDSDLGGKRLWYDGKTLTVYDLPHKVYGAVHTVDTIDGMLDQVAEQKSLTVPLAGFDYNDPCGHLRGQVLFSRYVGVNDAAGIESDHLAFFGRDAEFQLWLTHEGKPLPRKIVITYRNRPGQPQWEAVLSNWRINLPLPVSTFEPKIPAGTIKADFIELKKTTQRELKQAQPQ